MNRRPIIQLLLIWPLLLLVTLFTGCFSSSDSKNFSGSSIETLPPVFLTGPTAALLTNAGSFSAHIVMSNQLRMSKTISGELFVRGGKLLFAAEPSKNNPGGAFAYVADLVNGQGFVWSEALQGYAPVRLSSIPSSLSIHLNDGLTKLDGHPCQVEEAFVKTSDGSTASFKAFRALDLNRVPLFITSISNTPAIQLSLSKIRPTAPPADVFAPPTDFTKYDSAETMVTELILRQHNLRRRSTGGTDQPAYDRNRR
jgi:hypothetical protein